MMKFFFIVNGREPFKDLVRRKEKAKLRRSLHNIVIRNTRQFAGTPFEYEYILSSENW
ncbi:hypothetical protein D3C81_525060 [compost metagenome]